MKFFITSPTEAKAPTIEKPTLNWNTGDSHSHQEARIKWNEHLSSLPTFFHDNIGEVGSWVEAEVEMQIYSFESNQYVPACKYEFDKADEKHKMLLLVPVESEKDFISEGMKMISMANSMFGNSNKDKEQHKQEVFPDDLQNQVRDHIASHDLFHWHEALTENEMTYLENLLLTFCPLFPKGSIGYNKWIDYLSSQPTAPIQHTAEEIYEMGKAVNKYGVMKKAYVYDAFNEGFEEGYKAAIKSVK